VKRKKQKLKLLKVMKTNEREKVERLTPNLLGNAK
jgi:hypothetical protein